MKRMGKYIVYEHPDFKNFKQLVTENANRTPDRPAFQYLFLGEVETVTYKQFYEDARNLSLFLHHRGVENKKIALWGENSYYWILSYFAAVLNSNIIVPIDRESSDEEIRDLLSLCDAEVLIYSNLYEDSAQEMLRDGCVRKSFNMIEFPSHLAEGKEVAADEKSVPTIWEVDEDAVCAIIVTLDAAGMPKKNMLSQKNLIADASTGTSFIYLSGSSVITEPLHHSDIFNRGVLSALICGFPICINRSRLPQPKL